MDKTRAEKYTLQLRYKLNHTARLFNLFIVNFSSQGTAWIPGTL